MCLEMFLQKKKKKKKEKEEEEEYVQILVKNKKLGSITSRNISHLGLK